MAKFRIRLIVPNNDTSHTTNESTEQALLRNETFLASIITDYNDQLTEYDANKAAAEVTNTNILERSDVTFSAPFSHTISYTRDEKLSVHKNGQKTLTFSMDDKILVNNEWVENPYAHILRNGVQIELTDKYNNCMLFTVNDVKYTFNNINIVYQISCQDSFTYQLSRQNEGYQLVNDETSADFIGAWDIDEWAQRIAEDCYLTYEYIPLDIGIYEDGEGYIHTVEVPGDNIESHPNILLDNVTRIIKPIYNKDDYESYYETFPFAVSGSNAASALISLGEMLGLQLFVVEGYYKPAEDVPAGKVIYRRFFYFGPTKNPETTGLTYSPLRDVQNLNLTLSGNSLATVLNISSTTWNDEEIGLFNKMPDFFQSLILTDSHWTNTEYYPGFFYQLVRGKKISDWNLLDFENPKQVTGKYLYQINRSILPYWSNLYTHVLFNWDQDHFTKLKFNGEPYEYSRFHCGLCFETSAIDSSLATFIHNATLDTEGEYFSASHVFVGEDWTEGQLIYFSSQTWVLSRVNATINGVTAVLENVNVTLEKLDDVFMLYATYSDAPGSYVAIDIDSFNDSVLLGLQIDARYFTNPSAAEIDRQFFEEGEEIPTDLIDQYNNYKSSLYFYTSVPVEPSGDNCYFYFTRNYTTDELDFAEMAEECPWLENKLIDFNYFLNQGIISRAEYQNLMKFLTDDLRIINGQLMCFASAYFEGIHKQVTLLADLTTSLDELNATFFADVIDPYTKSGSINNDITHFIGYYDNIFSNLNISSVRKPLFNYNKIISDNFNKYFNAEQRFLKEMYNFRNYFNAQNTYSINGENILQDVTYNIQSLDNNVMLGFNKTINWKLLNNESPIIAQSICGGPHYNIKDVYKYQQGQYIKLSIPNFQNYKDFYVSTVNAGTLASVANGHIYNANNKYYWLIHKPNSSTNYFTDFFGANARPITTIEENGYVYGALTDHQLQQVLAYQNENKYYHRDTERLVPFETVRCDFGVIQNTIHLNMWPMYAIFDASGKSDWYDKPKTWRSLEEKAWQLYVTSMPIDKLYVWDYLLEYRNLGTKQQTNFQWLIKDENNKEYKVEYDSSHNTYKFKKYNPETKQYDITITDKNKLYKIQYEVAYLSFDSTTRSQFFNDQNAIDVTTSNIGKLIEKYTKANSSLVGQYSCDERTGYYQDGEFIQTGSAYGYSYGVRQRVWSTDGQNDYTMDIVFSPKGQTFFLSTAAYNSYKHPLGQPDIKKSHYNADYDDYWNDKDFLPPASSQQQVYATFAGKGDSFWPIYTLSTNANKDSTQASFNWLNNNDLLLSALGEKATSDDDVLWNHKHYETYYKYIQATYRLGAQPHHDCLNGVTEEQDIDDRTVWTSMAEKTIRPAGMAWQYDNFWVKNKYGKFCALDDVINPDDKYVWVNIAYTLAQNNPTENNIIIQTNPELEFKAYLDSGKQLGLIFKDSVVSGYTHFTPRIISSTNVGGWNHRFGLIKYYPLEAANDMIILDKFFSTQDLRSKNITIRDLVKKMNESNESVDIDGVLRYITGYGYYDNVVYRKIPFKVSLPFPWSQSFPTIDIYNFGIIMRVEPYEKGIINKNNTSYSSSDAYNIKYNDYAHWPEKDLLYDCDTDKPLSLLGQSFMAESADNTSLFMYKPDIDTELKKVKTLKNPNNYWQHANDYHWYVTDDVEKRTYTIDQLLSENKPFKTYYLGSSEYKTSEFVTSEWNNNTFEVKKTFTLYIYRYSLNQDQAIIFDTKTTTTNATVTFTLNNNNLTVRIDGVNLKINRVINNSLDIGTLNNGEFWYLLHNRLDVPNLVEKAAIIETQLTQHWMVAYTASNYCQWFIPESWQTELEKSHNHFADMIFEIDSATRLPKLSNKLIPDVEIVKQNNKTILPSYIYNYYENDDKPRSKAELSLREQSSILNNAAIMTACDYVFGFCEDMEQRGGRLTVIENGTQTYYHRINGGLERKDLIYTLKRSGRQYPHLDGLYAMTMYILLHNYYAAPSTQYEILLDRKRILWKQLYTRYPGIFLEKVYSNPDVRSSKQLLQTAKLAFKDYSSPEKQYSITILDLAALDGYQGQELHLGDGILVKASDYYDSVDETYRALNQYLFISDISYSLRQDTDLQLTVNTIKYQDKLLQSIVKLIR